MYGKKVGMVGGGARRGGDWLPWMSRCWDAGFVADAGACVRARLTASGFAADPLASPVCSFCACMMSVHVSPFLCYMRLLCVGMCIGVCAIKFLANYQIYLAEAQMHAEWQQQCLDVCAQSRSIDALAVASMFNGSMCNCCHEALNVQHTITIHNLTHNATCIVHQTIHNMGH